MKVLYDSKKFPKTISNPVVALGNFDGVHAGHRAILEQVKKEAKLLRGTACVYTFDPHPAKILAPQIAPALIQTLEQRLHWLESAGVDICVVEPFSTALSKWTPIEFCQSILQTRLHAASVWVGFDFTFGVKRSGNTETLQKFCQETKIKFHAVSPYFVEETLVHSTQIRQLIREGNVEEAAALLGHPFALIGKVVKGAGIGGKTLGIHTANLAAENELIPATGVYITKTHTPQGDFPSATNVGQNPTFPDKGFSIETHLLGFTGNLLHKKIEVSFLEWLRPEEKFSSPQALAKQIQKDILATRKYHGLSK